MAFGIDLGDVNRRLDNTEKSMVEMTTLLSEVVLLLHEQNAILLAISENRPVL